MTTSTPPAPPAIEVPRSRVRGVLVGVAIAVVFVLIAVVVFAVTRPPERSPDYLSPTSGGPYGARAVIAVLRDQGVDVRTATTLAEVRALDIDPATTTLVVYDYSLILRSAQRTELLGLAHRLVAMDPWDDELAELAPGVSVEFDTENRRYPVDCDLPAAVKAQAVEGYPYGYDVSDAETETRGCFATGEHSYGVVETRTGDTEVVVVGFSAAFTNGDVLEAGNAAFALNLLGEDETLVWYLPGRGDLVSGEIDTPQSLTPPWMTPMILLALLVTVVAGIWRGRRLGPLVAEKLPVVVRSNETMEGRARLYERAGARSHALDALRIGTIARLARVCGLPRRSSVDEIVTAVAALTGRDRDAVAGILVDRLPATDAELVRLSDDLLVLETETTRLARGR